MAGPGHRDTFQDSLEPEGLCGAAMVPGRFYGDIAPKIARHTYPVGAPSAFGVPDAGLLVTL